MLVFHLLLAVELAGTVPEGYRHGITGNHGTLACLKGTLITLANEQFHLKRSCQCHDLGFTQHEFEGSTAHGALQGVRRVIFVSIPWRMKGNIPMMRIGGRIELHVLPSP